MKESTRHDGRTELGLHRLIMLLILGGGLYFLSTFSVLAVSELRLDADPVREIIFAKGFISVPSLYLKLDGPGASGTLLKPNTKSNLGAAMEWGAFGLGLAMPYGESADRDEYGRTRHFDVQLRKYQERAAFELYLQSYRGYYLKDLPRGCQRGDPCSLRPKLRVQHAGFNAHYVVNPEWSIRAAFGQTGTQTASAGSVILSADINALLMDNRGPLLEGLNPPLDGGRFVSAAIVPGYGYTWVSGPWFFSPIFRMGFGGMYASYSAISGVAEPDDELVITGKVGIRTSGGYAGEVWRIGMQVHVDGWWPVTDELDISWYTAYGEFYVGRFF